jgi:hypothetical protein
MDNLGDLGKKLVDNDLEFGHGGLETINVKAFNKFGSAMSDVEFEESVAGSTIENTHDGTSFNTASTHVDPVICPIVVV